MPQKKASDLKKGNHLLVEGSLFLIEKIETSKIAKHGKAKVRIEGITQKGEKKIFVRMADDVFDTS